MMKLLKNLVVKNYLNFSNQKLMIKSKLKNRNLSQEDVFNFSELFKLMKPRVMSLVIFTCAVGLLMAPNIIPTKDAIIGIIYHQLDHIYQ